MSVIGQRVFAVGGNQLYMSLGNEEYVRPLGISSNWTRLRIGLLLAHTPDGTNSIPTCKLFVGLCSGTSNPYGTATTTNAIGFFPIGDTGANGNIGAVLNYQASSGNPYLTGVVGTVAWAKKTGTTFNSLPLSVGAYTIPTNTGAIQRRGILTVDIGKGSPNYALTVNYTPGANPTDFTFTNLLDVMEQASTITLATSGISLIGWNASPAFSETPGSLDTLDIAWNKTLYPLEIYGIAVYRMS